MSFIRCPYCQSTQVRQTDSGNAHANYFEQLQRCISPTQMAMFGMQVAKKAGVSPFIGVAIGVVAPYTWWRTIPDSVLCRFYEIFMLSGSCSD